MAVLVAVVVGSLSAMIQTTKQAMIIFIILVAVVVMMMMMMIILDLIDSTELEIISYY